MDEDVVKSLLGFAAGVMVGAWRDDPIGDEILEAIRITENHDHFERIPGIEIENWAERPKKK